MTTTTTTTTRTKKEPHPGLYCTALNFAAFNGVNAQAGRKRELDLGVNYALVFVVFYSEYLLINYIIILYCS